MQDYYIQLGIVNRYLVTNIDDIFFEQLSIVFLSKGFTYIS